jgi:hypothetical protein
MLRFVDGLKAELVRANWHDPADDGKLAALLIILGLFVQFQSV